MAANVSESPGQPPGRVIGGRSHSPPRQMTTKEPHEKTKTTTNHTAKDKRSKDRQLTPSTCSQPKAKRRLESAEGHDDSTTDPKLETLCRKKFKPIAPKPTDHHQSVVTATVPIKDVTYTDHLTKGGCKNGPVMFMSPKVQLIPSMPMLARAPPGEGDKIPMNTSPYSMTHTLFPQGKYLNVMTPPARVSLTDVAGHYKTVVQLLPNGTNNISTPSHCQTSTEVAASKASSERRASKAATRSEQSKGPKITSPNSKTKAKPKASRYKYSLLMNGGSYDGAMLNNPVLNQKLQPSVTPPVSLNGGVRLNLPAVLTSSGVLQITVPSVGIANGQVQIFDCGQHAEVVQPTVVAPGITSPQISTAATTIATMPPVYSPNTAVSNVLTPESIGSDTQDSVSTPNDNTSALDTNNMSLDETLRAMLKSPRATASLDKQKETHQPKKTKPHRTSSSRSRNKGKKTQPISSSAPPVIVHSTSSEQSGGRTVIVDSRSNQSTERGPLYQTQVAHGPLVSRYTPKQSGDGVSAKGQNVQYGSSVNRDGALAGQSDLGSELIGNSRITHTRHPGYVTNNDSVNLVPLVSDLNRKGAGTPELSRRPACKPDTAASPLTAPVNSGPTNQSRQTLVSTCVTTSTNIQHMGRALSDCWSRTDHVAPRATSLPNFATGSRGVPTATTTPPVAFHVPTNQHPPQLRNTSNASVPSPLGFEQAMDKSLGDSTPVLSPSSVMKPMQPQRPLQSLNCVITTSNFVPLPNTITSSIITRPVFNSSDNVIVRNSLTLPDRSSSVLRPHDSVLPRSSIQPQDTIRPPGIIVNASQGAAVLNRRSVGTCTAVTYSHNTMTSVHSGNEDFPTLVNSPTNLNVPTLPTPLTQQGAFFSEMDRSRELPFPSEIGETLREDRVMNPARRQLQLLEEHERNPPTHTNGQIGSLVLNQPNSEMPSVIPRQTIPEPALLRQNVDASVLRPNEPNSLPLRNAEPSLFTPPATVVPHHAGILATAILRSRALERNPWLMSPLNVSTSSTVSNSLPTTATSTLSTTAGYSGGTVCSSHSASAVNDSTAHSHHIGDVLHLRAAPGMHTSLGRPAESGSWCMPPEGIRNQRETENLISSHVSQFNLLRQRRMATLSSDLAGVRNSELEQPGPIIPTATSGEHFQNPDVVVQSVPLHSNISANARNAMNEALQKRTRAPRIQLRRCSTPASVVSSQSHTSSGVITSNQECISSIEVHPQLGADRHTLTSTDAQHVVMGQPRHTMPHQHPAHHMHAVPGSRLSTDSVSHLPMPLMPPPSVLYGSSTPVPNLSMTPLHGVPLPGALPGHSMQGHGVAHQLHGTPPPTPHHGQSTGPNPQGTVNHMFVSTPFGPIHRSLYMPPPSPHPPDISLMSPRSYGQVHMHDSVLYSPRFSSPLRNLPTSNLTEGMFSSSLPRSFSDERLDTCCSVPYAHSPPMHDNSGHIFPPGFMSPSMSRNQPSIQTSLCNSLQRPFGHRGHQNIPERHPGPFFHEGIRHPSPHQLHTPIIPTSSFSSPPTSSTMTNVCSPLDTSVLVSAVSSCNPIQPNSVGSLVNAVSPAMSSTAVATPGSTISSSGSDCPSALAATTSPSNTTPTRVYNVGNTSDKYLPLELVVSSPSTIVTTPTPVTIPSQLISEQIVKFGDVTLECSRQILRESGRTVLCCWGCDYHTAEPKKMYRHQRRDEQPMKCQLCSHMGQSRCQLNQHFKEEHMDKDEDPFRSSAVT
ncbi:mucin-17-like [Asterias rubens]|uniref:mucin-17-like n=1 Tax=Asterias rubens TaxID=7604 RepID=UPI001455456D|nr:mucin-17-like [Asterias rubens]